MNKSQIGQKRTLEQRKRMSLSHIGKTSGKKGVKLSEKTKKQINNSLKGKYYPKKSWFKKGHKNNFGKHHIEETKKKISKSVSGLNSVHWQGGISKEPYSFEFNKELKFLIKERDNFICQICNKKNNLVVHHIDYNKLNSSLNNLITLCNSCHTKTNTNRKYWRNYFEIKS